jgi:predicted NAD/FAD-dependent oxidoreductase
VTRIAVIGGGIAGIVIARRLGAAAETTVFEKSRGVGGRSATRYAGEFEFDHGAQFFTARTPGFQRFLQPLIDKGIVANWNARFVEIDRDRVLNERQWNADVPHMVGVPRMNEIARFLSRDLDIKLDTAITSIHHEGGRWTLTDNAGNAFEGYDWVVLTAPAPQTALIAADNPELKSLCNEREFLGCFSLMLGFETPLDLSWHAAVVQNSDVSWISVNSSKPGRNSPFTLVVHSTNEWASTHIDEDTDRVREHLLSEASLACGTDLQDRSYCQLHRWRYANIGKQSGPASFINDETRLAACGDWFVHGRIEAAFSSASELASQLGARL